MSSEALFRLGVVAEIEATPVRTIVRAVAVNFMVHCVVRVVGERLCLYNTVVCESEWVVTTKMLHLLSERN